MEGTRPSLDELIAKAKAQKERKKESATEKSEDVNERFLKKER